MVVADLRTASTDPAESAVATHDLIARAGGTAAFKQLDVTDGFQFEAIVNETVREFGRLDVLVNNAGVTVSPEKGSECPIWEHEESAVSPQLQYIMLSFLSHTDRQCATSAARRAREQGANRRYTPERDENSDVTLVRSLHGRER